MINEHKVTLDFLFGENGETVERRSFYIKYLGAKDGLQFIAKGFTTLLNSGIFNQLSNLDSLKQTAKEMNFDTLKNAVANPDDFVYLAEKLLTCATYVSPDGEVQQIEDLDVADYLCGNYHNTLLLLKAVFEYNFALLKKGSLFGSRKSRSQATKKEQKPSLDRPTFQVQ